MNRRYNMEMLNRMLDAIVGYMQEHGYSPSVREIGEKGRIKQLIIGATLFVQYV